MNLHDIDTPAPIVDLDVLEHNIDLMAAVAREGGKALRPHTKTHKTPEIARMQLAAGAKGLTVAKLGEAEVMAAAGFDDIFVANQVVGATKVERLVALLRKDRVTVGVDSLDVAEPLNAAGRAAGLRVPVRIEVDTGLHRAGVRGGDAAVKLGCALAEMPGLELDGIFTYEGHANQGAPGAREAAAIAAAEMLGKVADELRARGISCGSVSVGSTSCAPLMARQPQISELRAGTYVFNDTGQTARGARPEDWALTVLATVVSRPDEATAIVDAGTKAMSGDRGADGSRHGAVLEDRTILFDWANEEHGHLDLSGASLRPRVGEKLRLVPYHVCTAVNMHDRLYAVRGDRVEAVWEIAGRGKLQ